MENHALLAKIRDCITSEQDPFAQSSSFYSVGDLLSDVYLECFERGLTTREEIVSVIRSKAIASGRESLPMFRSRNYAFEEMDEGMRHIIGLSQPVGADEDTENTAILLKLFDQLGVNTLVAKLEAKNGPV